jgi:hypothetical protein
MSRHPAWGAVAAIVAALVLFGRGASGQSRLTLPTGAVSVVMADADHRIDAGLGTERTKGLLFGAQLDLEPADRMSISLRALGGTLDPARETPGAESRGVGEIALTTRIDVLPWLRGTGSVVGRSYDGALARQHWTELSVGGEAHLPLIEGLIDGSIAVALIPVVRVTDRAGPDLALAGGARIRHAGERLDLSLGYSLHRYDFPTAGGVRRVEELSMLVFRAGLRIGGRRGEKPR